VKQADMRIMLKKASKSVCSSNVVVCSDPYAIDFFSTEDVKPELKKFPNGILL
jgi:hypothetical protein